MATRPTTETTSDDATTTATASTPTTRVKATTGAGRRNPAAGSVASSVSSRIDARRRGERPLVVNLRGNGRKRNRRGRKRYTRGFRDLQRFTFGGSRALHRLTNGFAAGFDSFRRRSGRSARRKRDGLLRDSLRNGTRAFSRAVREAGRAPYQLAREISTRRFWKGARRSRGLAAPWPLSLFVR